MIIKQVSVFLENKPGRLRDAVNLLAKNDIDISALSLADTAEYGILRIIVNDSEKAKLILTEAGITVCTNHVIAVSIDDVPGGSVKILDSLAGAGISIEYMYACVGKVSGKALMVIRTDNQELAEKTLNNGGFSIVNPADIYRI